LSLIHTRRIKIRRREERKRRSSILAQEAGEGRDVEGE
jgi:hypothetical protein